MASTEHTIAVGARFETVGGLGTRIWEVADLYTAAHDRIHARLRDVSDGKDCRTLAEEVLRDPSRFRPV